MNTNKEYLLTEKTNHVLNLVHDEFMESVIAGHDEVYEEWADFAAYCIRKVLMPEQRNGQ